VDHIFYGKLIIGGWSVTFAMIGFYALQQSARLIKLRRRIARWLEPSASPEIRTPEGESLTLA
jgi:hypothetical protein